MRRLGMLICLESTSLFIFIRKVKYTIFQHLLIRMHLKIIPLYINLLQKSPIGQKARLYEISYSNFLVW